MEPCEKQPEAADAGCAEMRLVYVKPVLVALGHMAQVTQKSGHVPDNINHPTKSHGHIFGGGDDDD